MPRSSKAIGIKNRIDCITHDLVYTGLAVDQCFPIVKSGLGKIDEVVPDSPRSSAMLKSIPYENIYSELISSKIYNVKMLDGGLLLLRYTFRNDTLIKHALGFYPSPDLLEFQNNADVYLEDDIYADIVEPQVMPSPIRFDYDLAAAKPVEHPKSHMTIGQYSNCRIPVAAPLTPDHFIALILRSFYNTAQKKYSESIRFDRSTAFERSLFPEEELLPYLCVPYQR